VATHSELFHGSNINVNYTFVNFDIHSRNLGRGGSPPSPPVYALTFSGDVSSSAPDLPPSYEQALSVPAQPSLYIGQPVAGQHLPGQLSSGQRLPQEQIIVRTLVYVCVCVHACMCACVCECVNKVE
jgi:hypothetical protein